MTIKRYHIAPGSLFGPFEDGRFVLFKDAQATIQKLGDELFAARVALHALEKQRQADIAAKDKYISQLQDNIRAAGLALGFTDADDY